MVKAFLKFSNLAKQIGEHYSHQFVNFTWQELPETKNITTAQIITHTCGKISIAAGNSVSQMRVQQMDYWTRTYRPNCY